MVDQNDQSEEDKKSQYWRLSTTPKKKRKNYIILAISRKVDVEIYTAIEIYLKRNHQQLSVARPKNKKELLKLYNRQIIGMVIDDDFSNLSENIDLVLTLKEKKENHRFLFSL